MFLYESILTFLAVDESDFGNSIELGIAFFCSGVTRLHAALLQLLVNGYSMINKPQFIAIIKVSVDLRLIRGSLLIVSFSFLIQAHLEERKEGFNLSILNGSSGSND